MSGAEEDTLYQSSSSPLQIIESFLEALTNADKDGRVVVNKQGEVCLYSADIWYVSPPWYICKVQELQATVKKSVFKGSE